MKRVTILLMILAVPLAYGQSPALPPSEQELVEEIKILNGKVADLTDARNALEKNVRDLQSRLDDLSAKLAKPNADYATQDDIKALRSALKDEDAKVQAQSEETQKGLSDLAKMLKTVGMTAPPPTTQHTTSPHADNPVTPVAPLATGPGFNYTVKPNDTLVKIAKKLFTEEHIKVSVDDILAANPSLKNDPKNLKEGEKLFIPAAKDSESADSK